MSGKPYSVTLTQAQVMALALEKFRDQYSGSIWDKLAYIFRRIMFFARSWFFDLEYHTVPLPLLKEALDAWKREVLPHIIYQGETFDCDDFARHFTVWLKDYIAGDGITESHASMTLPVFNGVGLALGALYKDGELLGGHAWSAVLATDEHGEPQLVFVEPQLGEIVDYTSSDGFDYELLAIII